MQRARTGRHQLSVGTGALDDSTNRRAAGVNKQSRGQDLHLSGVG